jgi:hypothetical protein
MTSDPSAHPPAVPWCLADHVQLRAVLVPLTGGYRTKDDVVVRTRSIRRRWRAAATRLGNLGCPPLGNPGRLRSALGCPPAFLLTRGRRRTCRLRAACPFCWAREVRRHWAHLDRVFFAGIAPAQSVGRAGRVIELDDVPLSSSRPARKGRAHGLSLVTAAWSYRLTPFARGPVHGDLDLLACFYRARLKGQHPLVDGLTTFARGPSLRRIMAAVGRPGMVGCFENVTADLSPDGETWRAVIHQVWMIPADAGLSLIRPCAAEDERITRVDSPWHKDVAWAVARACRYPRALLSAHAGGRPALQLITARRGLRLVANFGVFRRKSDG